MTNQQQQWRAGAGAAAGALGLLGVGGAGAGEGPGLPRTKIQSPDPAGYLHCLSQVITFHTGVITVLFTIDPHNLLQFILYMITFICLYSDAYFCLSIF